MALDAILAWQASPSPNVNSYAATFTIDSVAQPVVSVPRTAALDASGYTIDVASACPGATIVGGSVIAASLVAVDSVDSLSSAPVVPLSVTEPVSAPLPPTAVTLTLA